MQHSSLLYLSMATFGSLTALAQHQPADSLDAQAHLIGTAVVTGMKIAKTLANTPIATKIIGQKDIYHSGATHLHELLQQELPGIEFTHALSGHLHLNMAGFSGQGVLILLDGERLAGETMDNVDFARLNLSDIERIEIVKGAASALYGSQAAGGVINLISRRHTGRPWHLSADAQVAQPQRSRWGVVGGYEQQRWSNRFQVQHTQSEGYALENPSDALLYTNYALQRVIGGRTWDFKESLQWKIAPQVQLTGKAGYFFRERDYDAGERHRYRDFSGSVKGEWDMKSGRKLEWSYAFDQYDKSDFYLNSRLDVRDYSNVQHSWRALYSAPLNDKQHLVVGGDFLRDYLLTYQFAEGKARTQWSCDVFAQMDYQLSPRWELVGALRCDYHSIEGRPSPTLKLLSRYHQGQLTLRGGYGGGFRTASLKERYMHFLINDLFVIRGQEQLKAEHSHNFQLSSEWTHRRTLLAAAVHYNLLLNRITTSPPSGERDPESRLPYVNYINLPHLRVLSAEATLQQQWRLPKGRLKALLNYTYTHEETGHAQVLTPYLPARPHSANAKIELDQQWTRRYGLNLQLSARWRSSFDSQEHNASTGASRTIHYPGYALVRLGTTHRIGRALRLNLAADNLLNYRPRIYYYNSPPTKGIELSLGLTLDLHRL